MYKGNHEITFFSLDDLNKDKKENSPKKVEKKEPITFAKKPQSVEKLDLKYVDNKNIAYPKTELPPKPSKKAAMDPKALARVGINEKILSIYKYNVAPIPESPATPLTENNSPLPPQKSKLSSIIIILQLLLEHHVNIFHQFL